MTYASGFETLNLHHRVNKKFELSDIDGMDVIIDATGDKRVAAQLLDAKQDRSFLLNVVDVPQRCDFYFSSLLNYGHIKIAISSEGTNPTLMQCIRDKISRVLPAELAFMCERKAIERLDGVIDPSATRLEGNKIFGAVYLVVCGIGDPELLTLKAYRVIMEAEVVLYDHLISKEILDLIPVGTESIYVGELKGCHSHSQNTINELICKYADKGISVARLKSGDPYINGRGAEEASLPGGSNFWKYIGHFCTC